MFGPCIVALYSAAFSSFKIASPIKRELVANTLFVF